MCNRCSLLCDDVQAEIGAKEVKSQGLCRLGHTHLERVAHLPSIEAISRENGKEINLGLNEGLAKAADMLITAKHPLLFGWSHSTNETIREGLSLAETLKAVFDSNANMGLVQSISHKLHNMKLETSLEEVQNKGEFILYWGSNPVESSHRHTSRFTVFPRGENVPQGVESRVIGVIDVRETETMKMANHRIIIPHGGDSELARALIDDLTGKTPLKASIVGLPATTIVGLSQALRKSDFSVIFYGTGIMNSSKSMENLTLLAELIQTLRSLGKKAFAMPMWHPANDIGVIEVLNEVATNPAALDFSSGKPLPLGPKNTMQKLAAGEFDAALIVGSDALAALPGKAAKSLGSMRTIYIGSTGGFTDHRALLSLRVTDDILSGVATMTRADLKNVQLENWKNTKEPIKNSFEIIAELHRIIQSKLNRK